MPTSICLNCNKTKQWRNTRGSSIAGKRCDECGGKIVAATYNWDTHQHEPRGNQSKNTGRKFEHCALCGKRRTIPGGGRRVESDSLWPIVVGNYRDGWTDYYAKLSAGDMICWSHEPTCPTFLPQDHGIPIESLFPRKQGE